MITILIIAVVALIILAALLEFLCGNKKSLPYNPGCLTVAFCFKFPKKWQGILYYTAMTLSILISLFITVYLFCNIKPSWWLAPLVLIACLFSIILPIIGLFIAHGCIIAGNLLYILFFMK